MKAHQNEKTELSQENVIILDNERTYIDYLRSYTSNYKLVNANGKITKPYQYLEIFLATTPTIAYVPKSSTGTTNVCFSWNAAHRIYQPTYDILGFMLLIISDITGLTSTRNMLNNIMMQLNHKLIAHTDNLSYANFAPSYIVRFRNGYLNLKTKEFFKLGDEPDDIKQYHFIRIVDVEYKPMSDCDKLITEIVNRVLNDWSDNDPETRLYLLQVLFATLEANGRHKLHTFRSDGGDGKSSFIDINKRFAGGSNFYLDANIDEFDDDNIVNQLGPWTALIAGDDLGSNARLNNKKLPRFKSLISGQTIQVGVKFRDNITVQTFANFIQATNSDFQTMEATPAVVDRMIVTDWPNNNFRKNPITDFNLTDLINNSDEFYSVLLNLLISEVDYFTRYSVPTRSESNSQEMINDGDMAYLATKELYEMGALDFERLPLNVLYKYYINWLRNNNNKSIPLAITKFKKRAIKVLAGFGFEPGKVRNRITRVETASKLKFNLNLFKYIISDDYFDIKDTSQSIYFVKPANEIMFKEIEAFIDKILELAEIPDDLTVKEQIILSHLVNIEHKPEIMAFITDEIA